MTTLDSIKTRLIDKILIARDENLLNAIEIIFNSTQTNEKLTLTSHQIEMLMMSEKDIEQGNLVSESDMKKTDEEWMN